MVVALGIFAFALAGGLWMPVSRELMLKLGTLVDMTRRADPERFATKLEPINPFVGSSFKHNRLPRLLRADLSEFGEVCQRLQREARKLDRRAHVAMLPVLVYLAGLGLWHVLLS